MGRISKPVAAALAGVMLAGLAAACGGASNSSSSSGSSTSGGSSSSGKTTTISVGYQPDLHGAAPMLIAQQQGFFKQEGLNVNLVRFPTGPPLFAALQAGKLQFGYEGPGVAATVIKGGGEIITVDSLNKGDEIVANPSIKTVQDLKGQTVGVSKGTSAQMILDLALTQAFGSVKASGVTEEPFGTPAAAAQAYSTHSIKALALWIPPIVSAAKAVPGTNTLVTDSNFITPQRQFPQFWLTMKNYAQQNPQVVTKFLQAWIKADNWRKAHTSQAVTMVAAATQTKAASLQPQVGATEWKSGSELGQIYSTNAEYSWFQNLEQFFVTDKLLPSVVPPSQFINTSYFTQALKADGLG
jgi:NitT/TauT family transport system substrate-binding protein